MRVKRVTKTDRTKMMYDLKVNPDHTFIGNGIISHNTNFLGEMSKEQKASHAFHGHIDNAELLYAAVRRRMKTRFMQHGKLPGKLFLVSSKRTLADFTERRIAEALDDPHVFVREYCLTGDTKIKLLNGQDVAIKDLVGRDSFYVYSIDTKTGNIKIGKGHHARLTIKKAPVYKMGFDDGTFIRMTENHPLLLPSLEYCQAKDLNIGDSIRSIHSRINHQVMSYVFDVFEDVYDLTVDDWENFTLSNGVVVHNSAWSAKDPKAFLPGRFQILVGNNAVGSRILKPEEDAAIFESDPNVKVISVPDDFRDDFDRDIDKALRDLGGIATVAIAPFIRNREFIDRCVEPSMTHPFTQEVWDMTDAGKFITEALFDISPFGEKIPKLHPNATRHVHIDPSMRGDGTGLCIGHIHGTKEVVKMVGGEKIVEIRPMVYIDLMLRVKPLMGSDIIYADLRKLVYSLTEAGFPIRYVSADSYQSFDMIQAFAARGYESQIVSVDRPMNAYDTLRSAIYEERLKMYNYPIGLQELKRLEYNVIKNKVDHPSDFQKDVADAICGVVYSLHTKFEGEPFGFYTGQSIREENIAQKFPKLDPAFDQMFSEQEQPGDTWFN